MAHVHGLANGRRYNVTMKPDPRPASRPPSALLDRIGATGSLVCAVHCAALPLLIALLPSLGIATWLGDGFELGFVVFAAISLYVIMQAGDKVDMSGEKHGADAVHVPDAPASAAK